MYTSLINASRLSIIVTGNSGISLDDENGISLLKNNLNNYFGNIKQLPFEKQILPDAQFTQMTQVSRLKRIFTTNIKAEDAGPRPEKLIPTTEFFDPALLILQSPKKIDENYYLYSLSMRGFEKFLKDDADSNKHFSDLEIIYFEETDGFVAFQFYEVKNSTELYKFIEKKFVEYSKQIEKTSTEEFSVLKTYWTSKEISQTNTSENLAKKIWSAKKLDLPTLFHINQYEKISNLSLENYKNEFSTKLSSYFEEVKPYWIFSADTKR
jgi:zinc protease